MPTATGSKAHAAWPYDPIEHLCVVCKQDYPCYACTNSESWACSTVNGDEDANMCDTCLDDEAESQAKFLEKNYGYW